MTTSTGVVSTGGIDLYSYLPPSIESVAPSYVLSSADSDSTYSITLIGRNLAAPSAGIAPSSVTIGGVNCERVVVLNESAVQCQDIPAHAWANSVVSAELAGQAVTSRALETFRAFR